MLGAHEDFPIAPGGASQGGHGIVDDAASVVEGAALIQLEGLAPGAGSVEHGSRPRHPDIDAFSGDERRGTAGPCQRHASIAEYAVAVGHMHVDADVAAAARQPQAKQRRQRAPRRK